MVANTSSPDFVPGDPEHNDISAVLEPAEDAVAHGRIVQSAGVVEPDVLQDIVPVLNCAGIPVSRE